MHESKIFDFDFELRFEKNERMKRLRLSESKIQKDLQDDLDTHILRSWEKKKILHIQKKQKISQIEAGKKYLLIKKRLFHILTENYKMNKENAQEFIIHTDFNNIDFNNILKSFIGSPKSKILKYIEDFENKNPFEKEMVKTNKELEKLIFIVDKKKRVKEEKEKELEELQKTINEMKNFISITENSIIKEEFQIESLKRQYSESKEKFDKYELKS